MIQIPSIVQRYTLWVHKIFNIETLLIVHSLMVISLFNFILIKPIHACRLTDTIWITDYNATTFIKLYHTLYSILTRRRVLVYLRCSFLFKHNMTIVVRIFFTTLLLFCFVVFNDNLLYGIRSTYRSLHYRVFR